MDQDQDLSKLKVVEIKRELSRLGIKSGLGGKRKFELVRRYFAVIGANGFGRFLYCKKLFGKNKRKALRTVHHISLKKLPLFVPPGPAHEVCRKISLQPRTMCPRTLLRDVVAEP